MVLYDERGNFIVGAELALATRKARQIKNERRLQRPPAAMDEARNIVLGSHSTAQLRSLNSHYNCMGMVFASRRTCIDTEELGMILEDDGYRPVVSENDIMLGDIVVYRNMKGDAVHVGMVAGIRTNLVEGRQEIVVMSQWGGDGEYLHRADDVSPLLGVPSEYWTDRT